MPKQTELFDLIRSLSPNEKRYFKRFCGISGRNSNYVRLFDAIDGLETYDEGAIKERFRDETFIEQLHVTKHYLRDLILKSLRNFHGRISRDAEVRDILRNVEILFHKELYGLCRTMLARAEKLAETYDIPGALVEVHGWHRRLDQAADPTDYPAFRQRLEKRMDAIDRLQVSNRYWQLAVDITSGALKTPETDPDAEPVPLLEDISHARTVDARVLFHNMRYFTMVMSGDSDRATSELQELLLFLEEHPHRLQQDPGPYISTLNNLISHHIFNRRMEEARELIDRAKRAYLRSGASGRGKNVLLQILRTYNLELEVCRDTGAFADRMDFIAETERFIESNLTKVPREYLISFWFQLASIHFQREDFDRSLGLINRILNEQFHDVRTDLQIQARMLNLMVHLERRNLFVLRYFVDNTRRFMKKFTEPRPFETALLEFFIRIDSRPLLEHRDAFSELRDRLFPADGEPLVPKHVLDYIDYAAWIERKLA